MHNPLNDAAPPLALREPPLERVLAAVAFSPILKIGDSSGEGIADFQELVRDRYPQLLFETEDNVQLQIGDSGELGSSQVVKDPVWRLFDAKGHWRVSLSRQTLAVETVRHYETRDDFVDRLMHLVGALNQALHPGQWTRIGFRYLNVFGPKKMKRIDQYIRAELNAFSREPFKDLVRHYSSQAAFSIPEGELLIKYGLLAPGMMHEFMLQPTDRQRWFLDIDAFSDLKGTFKKTEFEDKARALTGRACSFFAWSMTKEFTDDFRHEPAARMEKPASPA